MKRLIVPTDFSETAWNAVIHASEYCKKLKAEMLLVNVVEYSPNNLNIRAIDITDRFERNEFEMRRLISRITETFQQINVNFVLKSGSLFNVISNLQLDNDNDIIVMGTHKRSGIRRKLFGSYTSRILKDVTCPVLVIPKETKFSLATPVICAINYDSKINSTHLELLKFIIEIGSSPKLNIIHIKKGPQKSGQSLPLKQFQNLDFQFDENIGNNISQLLEENFALKSNRLLVLVKKEKVFLKRLFHKSISNELSLNATVPLLVLAAK